MIGTEPPPRRRPQGVEYRLPNGTRLPLELAYGGLDSEDGCHVWLVATPPPPGATVHVAMLPARTAVSFPKPGAWLRDR